MRKSHSPVQSMKLLNQIDYLFNICSLFLLFRKCDLNLSLPVSRSVSFTFAFEFFRIFFQFSLLAFIFFLSFVFRLQKRKFSIVISIFFFSTLATTNHYYNFFFVELLSIFPFSLKNKIRFTVRSLLIFI